MSTFDKEWLKSVHVRDVPGRRKGVIYLDGKDSVLKALKVLEKNDILSAPVWNAETKQFIGSMDMHHIVNLIATNFTEDEVFKAPNTSSLMEKQKLFTEKPIQEIFDFSIRNPFHHVRPSEDLLSAITEMAGHNHYIRRSLVFKDDATTYEPSTAEGIVSQTAIITFLSKNISKLGNAIHQPIDQVIPIDWESSKQNLISISANDTVAHAFKLMQTTNVSGLAVLDEHASLLGTIGIRDLKFMVIKDSLDLSHLKSTVREYMNYVRQQMDMERHPAISIRKVDTFGTLIAKIASTAVHRIFIIDDHNIPIGVVGSLEVLKAIVS